MPIEKNAQQQQLSVNQGCLLAAIPKPKVDTISSIYVQMGEEYIKAWYKWCTICSKNLLKMPARVAERREERLLNSASYFDLRGRLSLTNPAQEAALYATTVHIYG